jgi:hypothetical protein
VGNFVEIRCLKNTLIFKMKNFRDSGIVLAMLVIKVVSGAGLDGVKKTTEAVDCNLEAFLQHWIECFQAFKDMVFNQLSDMGFEDETMATLAMLLVCLAFVIYVASKYFLAVDDTAIEKLKTLGLDKQVLERGSQVKKDVQEAVQSSLMATFNRCINQLVGRFNQADELDSPNSSKAGSVDGKKK